LTAAPDRGFISDSLVVKLVIIIPKTPSKKIDRTAVSAFLSKTKAIRSVAQRQPRLVFALDATASREPTWQQARGLHQDMFRAAQTDSHLAIQLCYFRGFNEFQYSPWLTSSDELLAHMEAVSCLGGATQITRLLQHYLGVATPMTPVRGLVFIGDAVEEPSQRLLDLAGQCRVRHQPLFLFQEGRDHTVAALFEQMAGLSGGVYARFDHHSADYLKELLGAVVRYAQGGRRALTSSGRESDKLLLMQLPRKPTN